ncbi:hypothetical protein [Polyangium sp. 15x6]|uniref:hypothetical protein n=1 Tax=Polyangium sp. 15x6 TaxID=3042687 RepID=UPI00249A5A4E|nr:hypothetical protein [Polyangium sp. 15x6]MDI3286156.1 hypothetical protein [Polyangium sp. 15x6]
MLRPLLASSALAALLALAGCTRCPDCQCMLPGIHVTVVDASTKQAIAAGVEVKTGTTSCDLSVSERICNVAPGAHTVEVSAMGYTSKTASAVLPEPEKDTCCACGASVPVTVELTRLP